MKKNLFNLSCLLACTFSVQAQTLYSTAFSGGNENAGAINKFITGSDRLTVNESFEGLAANPQYTNFVQASDGKLYAMTSHGGSTGGGVIFSLDPSLSTYRKLKDFDEAGGQFPTGSLIQAKDGKLYGMTSQGGNTGGGVIFSFDPSSSIYTKLKEFDEINGDFPNGEDPNGSLLQASDGKLYGMTSQGGSTGNGVIFSFDPSSSTYTKLKDFDEINGDLPTGSLVQAKDGKLYGMTNAGGGSNLGVIFSFDLSTSAYIRLKDFDDMNGANPYGSLMQASDGKLYGMTIGGGSLGRGVIFSFDLSKSSYIKLKDFDNTNGANPYGSLMQAGDGRLYGTTFAGGTSDLGVIFSFDLSSSAYKKLNDFDDANGANPYGSLIQAGDGKLYGMTLTGGLKSTGFGIIFSLDPASSRYIKVKDFGTNKSGSNPSGSLSQVNDGKLYGMTTIGGSTNAGVIFSFDPRSSVYKNIKDFDYTNGANPYGSLIQAGNGKLYGMTSNGGSSNYGVIFSFDISSSSYTKLKDFDYTTGANPYGSLVQAKDGKLYGMTTGGGSFGDGVIFSFDPLSFVYTTLKDFDYSYETDTTFSNGDGYNPSGSLIQASDGKLYGMTTNGGNFNVSRGGNGSGIIFSFDPTTFKYTKLMDFDAGGYYPYGSLIQARNGQLYGMTSNGGSDNSGVIFSYNLSSSSYTKLKDFDNTDGADPSGSLMQGNDGLLYGMTNLGGSNNLGVIFSFNPSSFTYKKLQDYNGFNGANPYIGSAFIEVPESGPVPVTLLRFSGENKGNFNQLSWEVENEVQLNYYELERSTGGQIFEEISRVNASGASNYTYNDNINAAVSPVYYYRLKSVDTDGDFTYSNIIILRTGLNGNFVTVNPNPFKDKLVITFQSPGQDKATMILTDLSGKQLLKENKLLPAGTSVIEINETGRLSKGTYLLTIIESQQTKSFKVIKGN